MNRGRHRRITPYDAVKRLTVVAAGTALAILALYAVPMPDDAGATQPATAQAAAAGCIRPKVTTKMDYGSGDLGPLGTRTLDGSMATADVALFGDSISVRGCGELKAQLAALGKTLATDAQGSRAVTKTADDIEAYAVLPPIVLMAVGTNDIFNPTLFGPQMDRILAHLKAKGVEHVLWIDVQVCRTRSTMTPAMQIADQRNSMGINTQIHDRLPKTHIVPWAWAFVSNPSRLAMYIPDGVHPDADGVLHWVAWIMPKLKPLLSA